MKKVVFLSFLIFSIQLVKAQNWGSLGMGTNTIVRSMYADTTDHKLYVGKETMGSGINNLSVWNGTSWDSLGNLSNNVFAITKFQGNIVIANGYILKWDGSNWIHLGSGGTINLYNHMDNDLYAVGWFDTIGGISASKVAKWNGSTWSAIDTTRWIGGAINCAIIFQDHLYIGGNFYDNAGTISRIARWDSTHWEPLGTGILGSSMVFSFEVYNNELYVGGVFDITNGNPGDNIARWDGSQWHSVGGGMTSPAGITKLKVYNGYLYAIGSYYTAGGVPAMNIAKWDGINWCGIGYLGSGGSGGNLHAIAAFEDELYIGGSFTEINGVLMNHISKWIGGDYVDTCGHLSVGIIESTNIDQELNLYPNPAQSTLTLQFPQAIKEPTSIEIKNMLGQTMKALQLQTGSRQQEIDVSDFSNGVYFVQCQSKSMLISKKFVKQ